MTKRLRRTTGFTLTEVLVYMFLLGLSLSSIYSVLIAGMHYFHTASVESDLQGGCMVAIDRLSHELSESDPATVQISNSPSSPMGISFASPRDTVDNFSLASGTLNWEKFIGYYVDPSIIGGQLIRKEDLITPTSTIPVGQLANFTPAQFVSITVEKRLMARNVTSFACTLSANQVTVKIVADGMDAAGTIETDVHGNALNEVRIDNSGILIRN